MLDIPDMKVRIIANFGRVSSISIWLPPGGQGIIVTNTPDALTRRSVTDEAALARAFVARHIAAAGLDVFQHEPAIDAVLVSLENVVLLPHLGSATIETRMRMGMPAAASLDAFFAGREPTNHIV